MLDVNRLRLLAELSRRGTIAAVARTVGYTPSAVSQSLAKLEREAGVALLEREGRRVRLTPAARALVERADRVLAELDAAEHDLAALHESVHGSVVIGAFPSAAAFVVVPALQKLAARYPELEATVREHEPEDGIPLLRAGELDLLISESYDDVPPAPAGGLGGAPAADRADAARAGARLRGPLAARPQPAARPTTPTCSSRAPSCRHRSQASSRAATYSSASGWARGRL